MTQGSDSIRFCLNKRIKPPSHASLIDTWQGGFGLWRLWPVDMGHVVIRWVAVQFVLRVHLS